MESGHSDEILCIPGDKRNYGIELFQVVEICSSLQISKVPCLPDCYAGVCNYKGTITPVVRLWEEDEADSGYDGNCKRTKLSDGNPNREASLYNKDSSVRADRECPDIFRVRGMGSERYLQKRRRTLSGN